MQALAIIAVIIIAAIVGTYFLIRPPIPAPTIPETLVIDVTRWPFRSLNQLLAVEVLPWPNYNQYTHFQPLACVNLTALFEEGGVEFLPCLAEQWEISPDGKTYTFYLREDVEFDNGDEFNSYHVWVCYYGLYWLSGNASNFMFGLELMNMSNVNYGPAHLETITDSGLADPTPAALAIMENESWPIYCEGPDKITFKLAVPFAEKFFFGVIVGQIGLIYDAQYLLDHGGYGEAGLPNPYFNEHIFPGTGPYKVDELVVNSYVKYSKNPYYWGNQLSSEEIEANPVLDPGHVDNVQVNVVPDDLTRYTELKTGEAHISAVLSENWKLVEENPDFSYFSSAVSGNAGPREGVRPRYSGLRVQGTASSPSSTASRNASLRASKSQTATPLDDFQGHSLVWTTQCSLYRISVTM